MHRHLLDNDRRSATVAGTERGTVIRSGLVMLLLIMLSEQSSLLQLVILWNIDAGNCRQHERIDR